MLSAIEEYLQSPQAVQDVGALAPYAGQGGGREGPIFLSCMGIAEGVGASRRFHVLKWNKIGVEAKPPAVHWVYLRKDGDRFIVTDLGEGFRVYALRTGDIERRNLPLAVPS